MPKGIYTRTNTLATLCREMSKKSPWHWALRVEYTVDQQRNSNRLKQNLVAKDAMRQMWNKAKTK